MRDWSPNRSTSSQPVPLRHGSRLAVGSSLGTLPSPRTSRSQAAIERIDTADSSRRESRQSPPSASGTATAAAIVEPVTMPPAYAPVPSAGRSGMPLRDDHRRDGSGDPDADPKPERGQEDEREVRCHGAQQSERDDEPEAHREGRPRAESRREAWADRGEDPHAQHRDRRQEAAQARREVKILADQGQQRPDREQLRAQGHRCQEQPDDDAERDAHVRGGSFGHPCTLPQPDSSALGAR